MERQCAKSGRLGQPYVCTCTLFYEKYLMVLQTDIIRMQPLFPASHFNTTRKPLQTSYATSKPMITYSLGLVALPKLIPTSTSVKMACLLKLAKSSSNAIRPFSNATMMLEPPNWKIPTSSPFLISAPGCCHLSLILKNFDHV